ncbi:MAG: alpha/beta fold hydrolase [Saprospiraceae bacterium]
MRHRIFSILKYSVLLTAVAFVAYLFFPREYNVLPYKELPTTTFWVLPKGSKIAYSFLPGKGQAEQYPIVYLHGGPGGAITERILESLTSFSAKGYDVYAYDQIGSGASDRLSDITEYSAARHVSDLEDIVKKIGAEKVILLGHSWGSVLATLYAVDNSSTVDRIIMTGPGPIFPLNRSLATLKAPDSLDIKAPTFSNQDGNTQIYTFRDKCIRWYAYTFSKKLVSDKEVDNFFTHLNSALNRSTVYDTSMDTPSYGGGGYYAHLMTMKSLYTIEDSREKMKDLTLPVLMLKGQYDNQKWGYSQEYLGLLPNSRLKIIPKAGHSIAVEQRELYRDEILKFLKES